MNEAFLGPGFPVVAIDVGGTGIKATLVSADGSISPVLRVPTPVRESGGEFALLDTVEAIVAELGGAAAAVGVVVPGVVDDDLGIVRLAGNLGFHDVPLGALLRERLGVPVAFGHDVRAAGLAEHRFGAAAGEDDCVVAIIGTGIAAALFTGGRPVVAGGYAGEIGHTIVDLGGEPCACGGSGHLESIASAGAITRRYRARGTATIDGARDVLRLTHEGDPVAVAVWSEALDALAVGLQQVITTLAPGRIVLGGGLAEAGDELLVPLRARLAALRSFHREPQLVKAELGDQAGMIGAALMARAVIAE